MMDSLETNVTTATEQSSEITEMNAAPAEPATPAAPVYTTKEEVVNRVKEIAQSEELAEKQELDLLKQLFYKFHNNDIQEARNAFIEGGGEPEKFEPQIDPLEPEFRASMQLIRDRRAAAQEELTKAQQGTIETVSTGQSAFVDEYGNMKSLGEIMNILRQNLGAVNIDLVDSEGNLREYDDIIAELESTEEGLTQAEQLKMRRSFSVSRTSPA